MNRSLWSTALFFATAFLLGVWGVHALTPRPATVQAAPPPIVERAPLPVESEAAPLVMLDAGHGGVQPGACYFDVEERFITHGITMLLKPLLEERGYRVLLTREGDVDVWLYDRASMANDASADLFVSIHANASDGHPEISGVMTYVQPGKEAGRTLGEAIHTRLLEATDGDNYGVQNGDLAVLRETTMPAALAEVGFMSNPEECARLADPDYQAVLAQAIAEGITDYLIA